jgi:hypothetical protein
MRMALAVRCRPVSRLSMVNHLNQGRRNGRIRKKPPQAEFLRNKRMLDVVNLMLLAAFLHHSLTKLGGLHPT